MMAKRKATTEPKEWRAAAGGNVKVLVRITPEQDRALREESFRRASDAGSRKPDASEVLREVLEEWMRKRAK